MMQLSDSTRARFDREVAKYPADQRQSAVMACLSIVQQEQGYVSAEAEEARIIVVEAREALSQFSEDDADAGEEQC